MSQCVRHYSKDLHQPYEVTASEEFVENGRILKKAAKKTVDPTQLNAGVSVSDFYMENVIAAGALDSLRECKLNESTLAGADNVDAQLGAIDAAVVADVEQNQTNEGE